MQSTSTLTLQANGGKGGDVRLTIYYIGGGNPELTGPGSWRSWWGNCFYIWNTYQFG
ncbi:MAG: hypothetical protein R2779_06975 [Crocinitomicaceae bacterium]